MYSHLTTLQDEEIQNKIEVTDISVSVYISGYV